MNSGMGSFARRNIGRCTKDKRHPVCVRVRVRVSVGVDREMGVGVGVYGPCTCRIASTQ